MGIPITNPNYLVQITCNASSGVESIVAACPDTLSLRVSSDWEPTLASLTGDSLNQVSGLISAASGKSPYLKILTGQVWRSSDPITFDLKLIFDTFTDTNTDVSFPVQKIISWASPVRSTNGPYIQAPGPSIGFPDENRLSVRVGRFLYFDSVVFPNVDVTWITAPEVGGQMIAAEVNLTMKTFFTPDRNDIAAIFGGGAAADPANAGKQNPLYYTPNGEAIGYGQSLVKATGLGGG